MATLHKLTHQVRDTIKTSYRDATLTLIDQLLEGKRQPEGSFDKAILDAKTRIEASAKTNRLKPRKSNFDLVASGKCPHDNARLADEVACKGDGVTRTCTKSQHKWYLNRKIHTCACRTCVGDRQKAEMG